jgi:DNA polymerase-1
MPRALIVSATNLLARGFLVVPTDRKSRQGEPVNGLYAVARGIQRGIAFKVPSRGIAVIDAAAPSPSWPPILASQVAMLPELLTTLGFEVVTAPDEVHVVAAYTQAALDDGDDVVVVGIDKRYAQLVSDRVWWYDANKDARYTPEMVYKRFGVGPDKVAQWLALVGDDDQMPGVAGIGAKGATGLLEAHGSVEAALAVAETIGGRAGKALIAAKDDIPRELARGTLDTKRPLPAPLAAYRGPAAAPLNALYDRLGFVELLVSDDTAKVPVTLIEKPEQLTAALAALQAPVTIAPLLEDPAPVRAALAGLALAGSDGAAYYVPFAGRGANLDPQLLKTWLEDAAIPKLGHDLSAVRIALAHRGIAVAGIAGDSAHASHLTNPSNWASHDLPIVAKPVLGRALPDEDGVRGVGRARKPWAQLPIERAADFAATYADASGAIYRKLSPAIEPALFAEYHELADTLIRMELRGLLVDPEELAGAEADFAVIEAELDKQIEALAGHSFNVNSSKQLGTVLFEELKLPVVSHTKTGWSTSIEALERIEHAHPIVALVLRWRLLRRLRDSWLISLRNFIDVDGAVHSRFHPARSFSGRLVNTAPDLSRVPGRTPEMARIRRAFVARPGHQLLSIDYSQLGLHVLAHLTKDPALVEPLVAQDDVHALTAAAVLAKPRDQLTPDERQLGKVVNFATFAGQGASALALQLNVSAQEAKALIERFDQRYSLVRAFQDDQFRLAKERGYIVTIAGRKWPIGGLESLDSHDRSYAERLARRATHEGSVSDVSRRGLLDADRALRAAGLQAMPLAQILDEVLFEVPTEELPEAARLAAKAMREAFTLEAPLRVGLEAGPNWADLEPYPI